MLTRRLFLRLSAQPFRTISLFSTVDHSRFRYPSFVLPGVPVKPTPSPTQMASTGTHAIGTREHFLAVYEVCHRRAHCVRIRLLRRLAFCAARS
jgi:hypothetical protein